MSKVAVVFWTGTGNTEIMANSIAEGVRAKGAEADVIFCSDFTAAKVAEYDRFAFGSPSMGLEVLEEAEFQPMWDEVKPALRGKSVLLFGSYDWGDGEWMRNWEAECEGAGITVADTVLAHETPDDDENAVCRAGGEKLMA